MAGSATTIRALRLKSWEMIHEVSGYVVSERLREMQQLLAKYSPAQPRVPAGNSTGGQWTSGDSGTSQGAFLPEPPPAPSGVGIDELPPKDPTSIILGAIDANAF